jgi:hypothetical protein
MTSITVYYSWTDPRMRNPRNFTSEKILRGAMRTRTVSKREEPSAVQVCVRWSVTLLLLLRGMSKMKLDG